VPDEIVEACIAGCLVVFAGPGVSDITQAQEASRNVELASVYRLTATSFRMSAELLEEGFSENGEPMPRNIRSTPFYFLVSHACELLLKAALLKRGVTPAQLRKPALRHDLGSLLATLESQGIRVSPESTAIITLLSRQHKEHDLRYDALLDDGKPTYTPEPANVYAMLDELVMATRIGQSLARDEMP
jgi:hypothetical protein